MSLMVNPLSSVSFRAQNTESVSDIFSRPGAFTKIDIIESDETAPKKHTFLKILAGTLVTAGVIAGALYGLKRGFPEVFKVTEDIASKSGMEKFKAYLTTGITKGADYVEQGAQWLVKSCSDCWEKVSSKIKPKK